MKNQLSVVAARIEEGLDRIELASILPPGGARNAIDCALWDLEAKRSGKTIWDLTGIDPAPVETAYTVGIDKPEKMHQDARAHNRFSVIKVKVGIGDPVEQLQAVREGAPDASLIVDANQSWSIEDLDRFAVPLADIGVELIEQPIHRKRDEVLRRYRSPVPLCADESCATSADLERLAGLYSAINIKLDKTGGLTEALSLADKARKMGFKLMVGNMMGSSLAMAPAFVVAQYCRWVDLDGPLMLWWDGLRGLRYSGSSIAIIRPALWG